MPTIKVADLAYGRLRSPDLDQAERFLTDFGMVRAARTTSALYMRGTGPQHHLHVTELGEPRFVGMAFHAASEEDLDKLSRTPGASGIEHIDEPGGGKRVRISDPHGYQVEVVHGIETLAPLPVRPNVLNHGGDRLRRRGELTRLPRGASQVMRVGHIVLMTKDLPGAIQWYRETFGLVCTDEIYAGDKSNVIASFNRFDRGDDYVDHHGFLCIHGDKVGLQHISFEVQDIDDVMMGHEHLAAAGTYKHIWGIGRHLLGSQVFDYWQDPWGRVHEHWTDTDVLNIHTKPNLISVHEGFGSQWGDPAPHEFVTHASP